MSFEFTRNGHVYRVHSEIGIGLAKVVVEEVNPPEPDSLEPSEDA